LAGFCVAWGRKAEIIDGNSCSGLGRVLALPSSGPHSNGYSLGTLRSSKSPAVDIKTTELDGQTPEPTLAECSHAYLRESAWAATDQETPGRGQGPMGAHHRRRLAGKNIPRVLPANTCAHMT